MQLFSRKKCRVLLAILFTFMFQGCTRTIFGVDEEIWKTLSPAERENVIAGYNERQKIYQEQEPARQTIAAISDLNRSLKKKNDIKIQKMEHDLTLKRMEQNVQKPNASPTVVHHVYTHPSAPAVSPFQRTAPNFMQLPTTPVIPSQNSVSPIS